MSQGSHCLAVAEKLAFLPLLFPEGRAGGNLLEPAPLDEALGDILGATRPGLGEI